METFCLNPNSSHHFTSFKESDPHPLKVTKGIEAQRHIGPILEEDRLETRGQFDLLAIVKGMVDAAGERQETNAPQFERRVRRAVLGYLSFR